MAGSETKQDLLGQFLKITGYTKADVLAWNGERRTFVTDNGGKYRLDDDARNVIRMAGPSAPKLVDDDRAAEEAQREAAENAGSR